MGKSKKILVQSSIINILTIFVYYRLSYQPELTPNISTAIAKNPYPLMDATLNFSWCTHVYCNISQWTGREHIC